MGRLRSVRRALKLRTMWHWPDSSRLKRRARREARRQAAFCAAIGDTAAAAIYRRRARNG